MNLPTPNTPASVAPPRCPSHPQFAAVETCDRCGTFMCIYCRAQPNTCGTCAARTTSSPPIGGWLIVALLFMALVPFAVVLQVFALVVELRSPDVEFAPDAVWIWEMATTGALALYALAVIPFFLGRRKVTPKLVVIYFSATFLLTLINHVVASALEPTLEPRNWVMSAPWVRLLIFGAWVNYFLKAERVRTTFVK